MSSISRRSKPLAIMINLVVGLGCGPGMITSAYSQPTADPLRVQIQTTQELSLEEAMNLALEQSPLIRAAELGLATARANLAQAQAAFSPTLGSSTTYRVSDTNQPIPSQTEDEFVATLLDLDYQVVDPVREATVRSTEITVRVQEQEINQSIQSVKLSIAEAYFDLQRAEAQVTIEEGSLIQQQNNLDTTLDLEAAGLSTRFDVLSAQANVSDAETRLLAAENNSRSRHRILARLLSFQTPTDVIAVEPLQPTGTWDLSLEETILAALHRREELIIQHSLIEQSQILARQAQGEFEPTLGVSGSIVTSDLSEVGNGLDLGYSLSATLNTRWFNGGATQAAVKAAELSGDRAANQLRAAQDLIREEVELAFFLLESNRDQIDASQTAVRDAEEAVELSQLRFEAGLGTQREVLDSLADETTARANLANSIIEYNRALIRLRRSVNRL